MTVADLKAHKKSLYDAMCRDLTEFEKNFLFISTGILAFSITFIKDIVKVETAINIWMLFTSWIFIIVAISLMMYAFLKSSWASDELWKKADDWMIEKNLYLDITVFQPEDWKEIKGLLNEVLHKTKKVLKNVRSLAVAIFITGLFFFAAFVSLNLQKEKNAIAEPGKNCCCKP
ncbi:MAG TPA: hypothetical protein VK484_02775 [Ferruginibacter sp.]|nr:hypothetical protein [Ferruginibacter sp.]